MDDDIFTLALTGDSIIARNVFASHDSATRQLAKLIREADLAFTNLEVLVNDFRGYPALESGGSHLAAQAAVIDHLIDAGFDLFATATNHALDYSIEGLLAMIDELKARKVTFAGIGHSLAEARMPAYHDYPHGTLALISCASSFAKGNLAGEQRPDMQGRPGLNPLRVETTYELAAPLFAAVQQAARDLGLERRRQETIDLGFGFPPDDPEIQPLLELNFKPGDQTAIRTKAKAKDVDAIARWVREARNRADVVVVSLHAHEQGDHKEEPAEFIPTFARRMIDEGADVVVGHGPHLLRGMEIYNGKPIFYSLGNFIAQNDLTYRLPADDYERFRVDPALTPSEVYRQRSENGAKGFHADRRYWETIVPVISFDGREVSKVELTPVALGHTAAMHRRGSPRRAEGEEAAEILERFRALSGPFGTSIRIEDGIGVVEEL